MEDPSYVPLFRVEDSPSALFIAFLRVPYPPRAHNDAWGPLRPGIASPRFICRQSPGPTRSRWPDGRRTLRRGQLELLTQRARKPPRNHYHRAERQQHAAATRGRPMQPQARSGWDCCSARPVPCVMIYRRVRRSAAERKLDSGCKISVCRVGGRRIVRSEASSAVASCRSVLMLACEGKNPLTRPADSAFGGRGPSSLIGVGTCLRATGTAARP